ncbi:immunoglobulin domain-containing protein [Cesiribacter andamanensis]|uniref:Ig-like domain-containing protein n=1 Tax=Cesiribacter andamanensis AMV16 TaxID=1279009 RepID=M7NSM2_9BACT|nr:hypothetical protein [Cesiribacter andamanensis]EMR04690.1 hypothetical protein ADICEAN_00142 [Cesiribacter andamanensis AMV16]
MKQTSTHQGFLATRRGFQHELVVMLLCFAGFLFLPQEAWAQCDTPLTYTKQDPGCGQEAGSITITGPAGSSVRYSIDGVNYANTTGAFTDVEPATYNVTYGVIDTNGDLVCTSAPQVVTINLPPPTPATPTVVITQPTCQLATGTLQVTAPTGVAYSIDGTDYTNTTGVFTGLTEGSYSVTARNSNGCTSGIYTAVINAQPQTPPAPTATVSQQPTCTLATGTITISAPTGTGLEFNVNDGPFQTSTTFSGLDPDNYNVRVRNADGCISEPTQLTVNPQPLTPAPPTVDILQPTCLIATATLTVSTPTGVAYSINGTDYTNTNGVFTGVAPGTYSVTARNSDGCTSGATTATVNAQPQTPPAPTATVSQQPTCTLATGTITISAPTGAGLEYNVNGGAYQSSTTFSGLEPNIYNIRVRNADGCISEPTQLTVNPQPLTPAAPVAQSPQIFCSATNPTVANLVATGNNLKWYNVATGGTALASGTALVTGNYYVSQTSAEGCESARTLVSVTVNTTPAAPTAASPQIFAQLLTQQLLI